MRCRIVDNNGRLEVINMIRENTPEHNVIGVVDIECGLFTKIINCGIEERKNHINELLSNGNNYAL